LSSLLRLKGPAISIASFLSAGRNDEIRRIGAAMPLGDERFGLANLASSQVFPLATLAFVLYSIPISDSFRAQQLIWRQYASPAGIQR
jgi:hypothetical protein